MRFILFITLFISLYANDVIKLSMLISNTVHSLQQERGLSCGFVTNKNFKNKLLNVYKKSDKNMVILKNFLNTINISHKIMIEKKLADVNKIRKNVLNHKFSFIDVYSKYTQIISFLLSEVSYFSNEIEDEKLKNLLYQYAILLMYKESIGEKRAELSVIFSTNKIPKDIYGLYSTSDTQEKIYLQVFKKLADLKIKRYLDSIMKDNSFKLVKKYEELALKKLANQNIKVDPIKWFEVSTKKINLIQKVEFKLLDEIKNYQKELKHRVFTKEEVEFINKKMPIKYVFDPNWKPFEYKDEIEQHRGIIADILKILKVKTGLNLIAVPTNSWSEAKKYVKEKKADMFSAISETNERKKYLNFTKNVLYSYFAVLISNKETPKISTIKQLKNKKIGIKKGYVLIKYLKQKYPYLNLVYVSSIKEGFEKLRKKEIDFFVNNAIIANYYINKKGYSDLKVAKNLDYKFKLKIAIRKDMPSIILDIMDKGLSQITQEELAKIYKKWVDKDLKTIKEYKKLTIYDILPIKQIIIVLFLFIVVMVVMLNILKKKKNITLGISVFIFVVIFLVAIAIVTMLAIKNIENVKKEEFAYSLNTILETTHESISKLLTSQEEYLNALLQNYKNFESKFDLFKKDIKFIDGYMLINPKYKVVQTNLKINKIYSKNFKNGLKKALKYGNTYIFPVKNSQKELHKIFFVKAIFNKFGQIEMYIAIGIKPSIIHSILEKGRMGHTGETYIINTRKELISKSRFEKELQKIGLIKPNQSSFLNIKVDTLASRSALAKHSGVNVDGYLDYRKTEVLGAWQWDSDYGIALISEIDKKEAMQSFIKFKTTIYYALFIISAFVVLLMIFIVWLSNKTKQQLELKNKQLEKFNLELEQKVKQRTKSLAQAKKEIEIIHKHTKDSIEFASLLQNALIADESTFQKAFEEYFIIWEPKDIVGGDIYFCDEIREDEYLIMVIDCTGHGVPGAFVTMIVKAVQREVIAKLPDDVSTSWIMSYFNKTIKELLKQENDDSISNAGFDGSIVYYNKKDKYIKFTGANSELLYVSDGEINKIKGSRYSVGYKKNDKNYIYKETKIELQKEDLLYLFTDGYIDQNGGEKEFPFGKKRLMKVIQENYKKPLNIQKEILKTELEKYQNQNERNDDITVIGMKI